MNATQRLAYWQSATSPEDCTALNGDTWTGEVELEGSVLWFLYRDAVGDLYQSKEEPAMRIDLRSYQYVCIPESQAWKGLPPKGGAQ